VEKQIYRQWWYWVALLVPIFIIAPILVWPHYGLFSDADQVISFPQSFLNDPFSGLKRILLPMDDGRWNPFFYALTVFIYWIFPESARAFYAVQGLMLLTTCMVVTYIIYKLTLKILPPILGVIILCTSSSIFENFYTLDKLEPRTTLFAALIICNLFFTLIQDNKTKKLHWYFILTQGILGIALIFTKETGAYLAAGIFLTWIIVRMKGGREIRINKVIGYSAIIQLLVVICFYALFKLLMIDGNNRYIVYPITLDLVFGNIAYYFQSSPELIFGISLAIFWVIRSIIGQLKNQWKICNIVLLLISLSLLAYFSGIILWRWPLDYYLLPAHMLAAILIPLSLYRLCQTKFYLRSYLFINTCLGVLLIGLIIFFGSRIYSGFFIYQQDALKDELAIYLAQPEFLSRRYVLTFSNPNAAEVGERIKFFSNLKRLPSKNIDLFNFWEPPSDLIKNINRFNLSVGVPPPIDQLAAVVNQDNKYLIWKYADGAFKWPNSMWSYDELRQGDLLLFPYSKAMPRWVNARGAGMYAENQNLPQSLGLKFAGEVKKELGRTTLGWQLFEVEKLP